MRAALGIGSDQLVLLVSGKLVSRKGPEHLLEAVKLSPEHLRARITVIFLGDGEMKAQLMLMSTDSPCVDARFVGFQNQTRLSPYYYTADLLVMPSIENETWGLVVNEALHHGLPSIVSDRVGCAPDLIKSGVTGEIFEAGSPESLAVAIQRTLPLVGRPETQEACRNTISRYTVEQAARGVAQVYEEITNGT
jgi:glycosyltransferase involved in cell wall biosynthesis